MRRTTPAHTDAYPGDFAPSAQTTPSASVYSRYEAAYAPQSFRVKRHRTGWMLVALFAVVVAVVSCGVFACAQTFAENAQHELERAGQTGGAAAVSTPKSEWRRGTIPRLYQTDPAWAGEPYAGTDVLTAGCGPACMTMVYVGLTGKTDYDPASMAAFSETNGFVDSGMTTWLFMTEGAAMLGLAAQELPADANVLVAALHEGRPVIASVRPGDFTTVGHFIVITGVDEAGDLVINDPNSSENSAKSWDAQRVLSQCANLWAYNIR